MIERLLSHVVRFVSSVLGWIWDRVWTEPVRSRGIEWTLWMWAHMLVCFYFGSIIAASHQPVFLALVLYYLSAWQMYKKSRPKSLGRKLRYRRHR